MSFLKKISRFLKDRANYRKTFTQLEALTDRELYDVGINRADIHDIAFRDMVTKRQSS